MDLSFNLHVSPLILTSVRIVIAESFRLFNDSHCDVFLPHNSVKFFQFKSEALKNRPIIYSGGGSTFASLRQSYRDFDDVIYISDGLWRKSYVKEMDEIVALGLCPILTTAYGLSNHASDDNIKLEIPEIFGNFSNAEDTSRYRRQDYEDSKDSV